MSIRRRISQTGRFTLIRIGSPPESVKREGLKSWLLP
jgi:hypothetical protein